MLQINIPKLRGKAAEQGLSFAALADAIGMSRSTMWRKMHGGGRCFTIGEVQRMAAMLQLSRAEAMDIFLEEKSQ